MRKGGHGCRKAFCIFFSRGGNSGFSRSSQKCVFQEGPKVVKFINSKLRKQPFLLKFHKIMSNFKIHGGKASPSDAHEGGWRRCNLCFTERHIVLANPCKRIAKKEIHVNIRHSAKFKLATILQHKKLQLSWTYLSVFNHESWKSAREILSNRNEQRAMSLSVTMYLNISCCVRLQLAYVFVLPTGTLPVWIKPW